MKNSTLTARQLSALQKKLIYAITLTPQSKICDFLELFFRCEVTAKQLINYHRQATNRTELGERDGYNIKMVKSAVTYYSLGISNAKIENIFTSDGSKSGNKTCRQLRNGYVHSLSNSDKQEIENRFDELKSCMNEWITLLNGTTLHKR